MHTMQLSFGLIFNPLDPARLVEILRGWEAASRIAGSYAFRGIHLTLHSWSGPNNIFQGMEVRIFIDFMEFFHSWKVEKSQVATVRSALVCILTPLHIGIEEMKVKSIDYCFNFKILDKAERTLLLELWNKTDVKYKRAFRIDPGMCKTLNRLYWSQEKYLNVQLYDKELERKDRKRFIKPYEHDLMRLEVQIRKKHIASQNRKFKESTTTPPEGRPDTFDAWTDWDVRAQYLSETRELFFSGDFYKITRAKTRLQKAVKNGVIPSKTVADNIYRFMVNISNKGIGSIVDKPAKNTADHYIRLLSQIGVNPIPIPRNKKISYLTNPLRSFYEGVRGVKENTTAPLKGSYTTIDGTLYFVVGKNRIKVTEYFPESGPTVTDLLENVIKYSAKAA